MKPEPLHIIIDGEGEVSSTRPFWRECTYCGARVSGAADGLTTVCVACDLDTDRRQRIVNSRLHKRSHSARVRAWRKGVTGRFYPADIRRMLAAQAGKCAYCGISFEGDYHVDHKTPLSRGGSNKPDNVHLVCAQCNRRKGTRTDAEFREGRDG